MGPMDSRMEELEKKMGVKIEAVKDMMLDRFSGVDQKLTAIKELLRKIIESQNQTGTPPETCFTENNEDRRKKVAEKRGVAVGGPTRETGSKKPLGEVADKTNAGEEEQQTGSLPSKKDSLKPVSAESDKGFDWSTLVAEKTVPEHGWGAACGKKRQVQVVGEWSNGKSHDESEKVGRGIKRKHPDRPVGGPNDEPMLSEVFTRSKRRLDLFTTDEQKIVNEIESIKQSIRKIMHQKGYNDGEPLSADDQAYMFKKVFNHHPEKAQKMGAGIDYIMISQHMEFKGSRCFYIVFTDGRKEDLCYHKCLWNFITGKYPNNLEDDFIPKYFEYSELHHLGNKDGEKRTSTDEAGPRRLGCRSAADIEMSPSLAKEWSFSGRRTNAGEEEQHTGSLASCSSLGKKTDEETDVLQSLSIRVDWSKLMDVETDSAHVRVAPLSKKGNNKYQAQVATNGSNEKGHDERQKIGPSGLKVAETTSKRHLDMFTTDEQEIFNEIESVKKSVLRIMNQKGYNDGDPLSADNQTYILENVFSHHPEKAQKMGSGVDYVMISNHMEFEGSRCFYIVSTDGRKEDFCYHKCLWNFITKKYLIELDEFIPKYFEHTEPHLLVNKASGGPGLVEAHETRSSWSGWDRETRVEADETGTSHPDWLLAADNDMPSSWLHCSLSSWDCEMRVALDEAGPSCLDWQ